MVKVITYGTFDLFHRGHYRLLQRAKELGDYLIVGVTTESYDIARGKINVVDSLMTRIENVRKSGFADEIIIEEYVGQKVHDVQKYNIDIFTVGSDWTGFFEYMKAYCEVIYLERTKNISSTMLREQKHHIQKIGIIGTGRIAARFIPEAKLVSGVSVQGVYNPHPESTKKFANKWEINPYENLDTFYESVDAVYIASPHDTHYEYIKSSLNAGKHVLCEKPMVLEKKQAEELFALANSKHLVLFEGIKTAYCPGFNKLLAIAGIGMIGKIHYIDACFTKLEKKESRELTDLKYGGSFTELGSYCLLPMIKLFGGEYQNMRYESIRAENSLDIFTKASFQYPEGVTTITCGLGVKAEGRLMIAGTEGFIVVEAPWWKTQYFEIHYEDPSKIDKYTERFLGDGLRYEVSDFINAINGNSANKYKLTGKESIMIADIMEQFLKMETSQRKIT